MVHCFARKSNKIQEDNVEPAGDNNAFVDLLTGGGGNEHFVFIPTQFLLVSTQTKTNNNG